MSPSDAGVPGLTGLLIWFLVIVAAIPAALWALRRTRLGSAISAGPLKVVGQTALGPGQRVVIVELQDGAHRGRLVLGVTAQSINLLQTLPAVDDTARAHRLEVQA